MHVAQQVHAQSDRLGACGLEALRTLHPHKLDHLILDAGDHPEPARIHPVFSGCYDWHSSVHMHWSLLRLRERVTDPGLRSEIDAHFAAHFTPALVGQERRYAAHPARAAFERPYGWAWLLKLQAELDAQAVDGRGPVSAWAAALRPFAQDVAGRLADFLPRGPYPVRCGTHANSAFAMLHARDYAVQADDGYLLGVVDNTAVAWFAGDEDFAARYEPGGADFLSGGLCEALLMSRVLPGEFAAWWAGFVPSRKALEPWLAPVPAIDRSDPQLVHLVGLNLSRAWCLLALAGALPHGQLEAAASAAHAHWEAGWPHVAAGDFTATHWLLTFAMLCEEAGA